MFGVCPDIKSLTGIGFLCAGIKSLTGIKLLCGVLLLFVRTVPVLVLSVKITLFPEMTAAKLAIYTRPVSDNISHRAPRRTIKNIILVSRFPTFILSVRLLRFLML